MNAEKIEFAIPQELFPEIVPTDISSMEVKDFFPSRILIQQREIEPNQENGLWQPIMVESRTEIGPRRMIVLFFNGNKSVILQYIFWEKKLKYVFVRRQISIEKFEKSIKYIRDRLSDIEEKVKESIKREKLPKKHEEVLIQVLRRQLEKGFRFRREN
ncbi:MAG: hypothetical protein P1P85_04380 [Patescibacteria group bacterium]|nr:hypothetical protein [Patescibacteria group bacterium]